VDAASVAAYRIAFGEMLLASTIRFLAHGWVREFYGVPTHFFSYWGFAWLRPLPLFGMYALYGVIALAAACLMLGVVSRAAAAVGALCFGYAHFCDKANYLNHYYLITLLLALLAFLPVDREFSVRVFRRPRERRGQVRAWVLYSLRFQIGLVYVFGGIGKLNTDWLFHVLTALLFRIGMFPWVMIVNATIFFAPDWPRRTLARVLPQDRALPVGVAGAVMAGKWSLLALLYLATQVLLPMRSALNPGNTLWSEEGFRFAWRVMLIEKAGSLEFEVVDRAGRRYSVSPRQYLTPFQARMASTQPDMILQLAHWIARDFSARVAGPVRVYADSEVSFNGRLRRRMIDPTQDLTSACDGLAAKPWILP